MKLGLTLVQVYRISTSLVEKLRITSKQFLRRGWFPQFHFICPSMDYSDKLTLKAVQKKRGLFYLDYLVISVLTHYLEK